VTVIAHGIWARRLPPDAGEMHSIFSGCAVQTGYQRTGVERHLPGNSGEHQLRHQEVFYGQRDDFSNRDGVFAATDALWAMMYALHGPGARG
jgi:hypothetical protein